MPILMLTDINPYSPLTPTEVSILNKLEKAISSSRKENIALAATALTRYSLVIIAKFIRHSEVVRNFCQSNSDAGNVLKAKLKENKSPNIDIISKTFHDSKRESHTIADHCFSYFLLDTYHKKNPGIDALVRERLLNDACELGSYQGLVHRCKKNLASLTNASIDKRDSIISAILQDADRLADLYGAIGYVRKGFVLFSLANFYSTSADLPNKKSAIEQGVKNFLCAILLEDDAYSKQIIDSTTNGEGLGAIFKQNEQLVFDKLDNLKQVFFDKMGKETYEMLYEEAKESIQHDVKRSTMESSVCSSQQP